MAKYPLPAWCRIVRRVEANVVATYHQMPQIRRPFDAVAYVAPKLAIEDVEVLVVMMLDAQNRVMGLQEVTRGLVNSSLVHPREVFRMAIVMGATSIVVAHNHPSGDLTPSPEDRHVTEQLAAAGKLLDIPLFDHLIVGSQSIALEVFTSFALNGLL